MIGANLTGAHLEDTNLLRANFSRAILWQANLNNSYLVNSSFECANFWQASVVGSDLRHADFRYAVWTDAALDGAIAHGADFRGALDLEPRQLDSVVGNIDTLLPIAKVRQTYCDGLFDYEMEGYLSILSCLDDFRYIDRIALHISNITGTSPEFTKGLVLCNGRPQTKTGTRLSVESRRPNPKNFPFWSTELPWWYEPIFN
jgi:hypothetical protein